jgi:hypothetical protein
MSGSLSIEELLLSLQRKGIPLPFEMGTFLVLEATEQVLALEATDQSSAFRIVHPGGVWLSDQGDVAVDSSENAPETDACHALVVLLGDLLVRSAPGVPGMLLEIVEQGPSDGQWTLMRLRDDLESALVPLNRGATRRVLSRLLREVRREVDRAPAAVPSDAAALELELDAVLGSSPGAAPGARPLRVAAGAPRQARRVEDETAEVDLDELSPHEAPAAKPKHDKPKASARPRVMQERAKGPVLALDSDGFDELERSEAGGAGLGLWIGLGLALLATVLGGAYLWLGQQRSRSALGLAPQPEAALQQAPARPQPERQARPRVGDLHVTSTPQRAQVLMLVGTAPAVAKKLPVGVAHEFVAMAEGSAPSRAVVPPDAHWQEEGGELRYELALQLNDAAARRAQDDLGPTRLSQQVGAPKGPLGSVRVVTSPPGAKVYQLIGFTPDVRVENLEVAPGTELLVYLAGYGLQHVVVGATDWKEQSGHPVAELDIKLTPRGK